MLIDRVNINIGLYLLLPMSIGNFYRRYLNWMLMHVGHRLFGRKVFELY